MQHRTCPTCGKEFQPTNHAQRYCPPTEADRQGKGQARSRCAKAADNNAYRSKAETATCKHCGTQFQRVRGSAGKVYCGDACHYSAKHQRLATARGIERLEQRHARLTLLTAPTPRDCTAYKRALRADPCTYCGATEQGGIDHIDPSANGGDDDWTNWTGSCKRCNAIKQDLPLLVALRWIPVSRAYNDLRRNVYAQ